MAPGERAQRLALMLLKELMGVTHHTDDDERWKALVSQVSDAAKETGTTLQGLLSAVVHNLADADPALFEKFERFAARVSAA